MKQNIILWTAAVIILFIAAYYKTLTGPYYPVSGSFGIDGEKVTFKFDKLHRGREDYQVTLRTEKLGISGYAEWKGEDSIWHKSLLKQGNGILVSEIPRQPAYSHIEYRAVLQYRESTIKIPPARVVPLEFRNKISPAAYTLFYFFLFGGLLLSIRTGLEYFRENSKVKALTLFTLIFFTLFGLIFSPLKNSYEAGFMGSHLPRPGEIFLPEHLGYFLIWLTGTIVLFSFRKIKYTILITSILILLHFLFTGYY